MAARNERKKGGDRGTPKQQHIFSSVASDHSYCSTKVNSSVCSSSIAGSTLRGSTMNYVTAKDSQLLEPHPDERVCEIEALADECGVPPSECGIRDLTGAQLNALVYANRVGKDNSVASKSNLIQMAAKVGYNATDIEEVETYLKEKCPLTIRINTQSLLPYLLKDKYYRSCFEVGLRESSYLSARRTWEAALFNGAYNAPGVLPCDMPKYGCLNVVCNPYGDVRAGGYGNSYLLLKNEVRPRVTIATSKEYSSERRVGTLAHCWHVVETFGTHELKRLLDVATGRRYMATVTSCGNGDALSGNYKELQIHGMVDVSNDVGALVVASNPFGFLENATIKHFSEQYSVPIITTDQLQSFLLSNRWSVAVKHHVNAMGKS